MYEQCLITPFYDIFIVIVFAVLYSPVASDEAHIVLFTCPWYKANTRCPMYFTDGLLYNFFVIWIAV